MYEIIIIALLILINGIFSMAEIALISARKLKLAKEEKKGKKNAKVALQLATEPDRFLSTVQIGITSVGILTGIYSGDTLAKTLTLQLQEWGMGADFADELAQIILVVIITFFTLILGELVPKRIGMSHPERVAQAVAIPMNLLAKLATPFVWILTSSTNLLFRLMGLKEGDNKVTEEEIKMIIQEGKRDGEVQEVEQNIVERVFLLGDLKVKNIMTHRSEIVWLDLAMNRQEVKAVLQEHLFEIYPVGKGSLDKLQGIVSIKDLALNLDDPNFKLENFVQPIIFFYENMTVYKVLDKFRHLYLSHALVIDEFGSCQGVISLKDILEGLVGELSQQEGSADIEATSEPNQWIVLGSCSFHDFLSYFDIEELLYENRYETVAGLLLDRFEYIPLINETITWYDFELKIIEMDSVRIHRILVSKNSPA